MSRWKSTSKRPAGRSRAMRGLLLLGCLLLALVAVPGHAAPEAVPGQMARPAVRAGVALLDGGSRSAVERPAAEEGSARPATGDGRIAVLYPDLGEPYRAVFNAIIDGIQEQAGGSLRRYPLPAQVNPQLLQAQLQKAGTRVVIALGRQGLVATTGLDPSIPVVLGGVLFVPETDRGKLTGISLTPDPAVLFTQLRSLLPNVRRVVVVYDPRYNGWLLGLARAAARAQGLELVAQEAGDTATAAKLYKAAIEAADGHEAIWLPQDPTTVDEDAILPLVLRDSWGHGVPVFSSSFPHVRKGVLFALYPDNHQMGRELAQTASRILAGEAAPRGMLPLQSVLTAFNVRTASHLGLKLDYQQQRRFDFVFPEL